MSLLDRLRAHKCENCGRTEGVENVRFNGEAVGRYCKTCRLFGAHTRDK